MAAWTGSRLGMGHGENRTRVPVDDSFHVFAGSCLFVAYRYVAGAQALALFERSFDWFIDRYML